MATWTYDVTNETGQVRLLIPDIDLSPNAPPTPPPNALFSDEEIGAFLALNDGNIRAAAAEALDVLASNEAMVQKVMSRGDLTTNGAATASELRARATALRAQADQEWGFVRVRLGLFAVAEDEIAT